MDLQNTFYIVAIVFMTVATIISFSILIFLIYSMKKVSSLIDILEVNLKKAENMVSHPQETASAIGSAVVDTTISRVEEMIGKAFNRSKKK